VSHRSTGGWYDCEGGVLGSQASSFDDKEHVLTAAAPSSRYAAFLGGFRDASSLGQRRLMPASLYMVHHFLLNLYYPFLPFASKVWKGAPLIIISFFSVSFPLWFLFFPAALESDGTGPSSKSYCIISPRPYRPRSTLLPITSYLHISPDLLSTTTPRFGICTHDIHA